MSEGMFSDVATHRCFWKRRRGNVVSLLGRRRSHRFKYICFIILHLMERIKKGNRHCTVDDICFL